MDSVKHQTRLRTVKSPVMVGLSAILVVSCGVVPSGPTKDTYVDVPDSDFALWNEKGKQLTHWNLSSERAAAAKLTYKGLVFHPPFEKQEMEKKIDELSIKKILDELKISNFELTLLSDGRVLASGGTVDKGGRYEIVSELAIVDPAKKSLKRLEQLKVPREDHSVVQLRDGRIFLIGGETESKYADDGTTNLTNSVEELDLQAGKSKIVGRILVPRHGVIAEAVGDREILIVGGWNERSIARDERWWPGAEIFRVPLKDQRK